MKKPSSEKNLKPDELYQLAEEMLADEKRYSSAKQTDLEVKLMLEAVEVLLKNL